MSGDVIALDPLRLAVLEGHLQGMADGCLRRAGRIGDELAGTGVEATDAIGLLGRVATWCADACVEVAWRRAAIEAMDGSLPLTIIELTPEEVEREARRWGATLERALAEEPPEWDVVAEVMGEVQRRLGSGEYAVALLRYLGPRRAGLLALRIEDAMRGAVGAVRPLPDAVAVAYVAAQATAADLIDRGTSVPEASGGLDDAWLDRLLGLPSPDADGVPPARSTPRFEADEAALIVSGLGLGLRMVGRAAAALEAGRAVPVLGVAGNVIGLVGVGLSALDHVESEPLCALGELGFGVAAASAGAASVVLAPEPPLSIAAMGASLLFGAAARWFGREGCGEQPDEPPVGPPPSNRSRSDPGDGGPPTFGGGGQDQPTQQGPGGPLPRNVVGAR